MKNIERQNNILTVLSSLIHNEADNGYELASCKYTFMRDFNTISSQFYFEIAGKKTARAMSAKATIKNRDLTEELHSLMKEHTGGEWDSFILTLDADGKATTKFNYPEK